jgi:phosphatidate cytidylyltransferase
MSELGQRIATACVLAPLGIAAVLLLDTPGFALLVAAIFAFGLTEWARLIGLTSFESRALLVLANVALMVLLWEQRNTPWLLWALVVGMAWWPLAALWLRHYHFAETGKRRNAGLKAVAGTLIVVPAWAAAVMLHRSGEHGEWWVLYVLVLVWIADVAAYFAGRRFGRTKLAPMISPGKTRAGVWGALAGATVYAAGAGLWLGLEAHAWAALVGLSLVTVLFSIVGDLFESLIKRHSKAKDSGHVLPGHGGVFDRFDSLFAALPIFGIGKIVLGL